MEKYEAVCAGHICIDLIPDFIHGTQNIENVFVPGRLSMVGGMNVCTGGSVANTGIALNKLGVRTCLMGNAGDDELGGMVGKILKTRHKISDTVKKAVGEQTSYSIVLSLPDTDRIFLHNRGANDTFTSCDVDMDIVSQARLFHFGYPPAMKKMYENGASEMIKMFREVKRAGAATTLDLCPPDAEDGPSSEEWKQILNETARYVDIILPSVEEVLFILDRDRYDRIKNTAGRSDIVDYINMDYIAKLGAELVDMGYKIVVLKCGKTGLYVRTASPKELKEIGGDLIKDTQQCGNKEYFSNVYNVKSIKSTVGAGDTSIAGFLTALLRGGDVLAAVDSACAVGALCVQTFGAVEGIPSYESIKEMIASGIKKIKVDYSGTYWSFNEKIGVHVPAE